MELYFIVTDDADACVMSDGWNEVWDRIPKREFYGLYILTDEEFASLNRVATEADVKEFNWMVDNLEQLSTGGMLYSVIDDEDFEIFKFLNNFSTESLARKYAKISDNDHELLGIDDLVYAFGNKLSEVKLKELDRLGDPVKAKLTIKEMAKYGDLSYAEMFLGKLMVSTLRSI